MKNIKYLSLLLYIILSNSALFGQSWQWGTGSSGSGMEGYAVATDGLGSVYAAGHAYSGTSLIVGTITVPPSLGLQAVWVKYNSSTGVPIWAEGTQNGNAQIINITTDASNNFIVFGSFNSPIITIGSITLNNAFGASGGYQYFIAKYNSFGTLLWAICDGNIDNGIGNLFASTAGVTGGAIGVVGIMVVRNGSITTDATGYIYVTSTFIKPSITIGPYTLTNADPTGMKADVFVAKYNSAGVLIWATRAGGSSDDFSFAITVVPSGNVYIAGAFWSPTVNFGSSVISDPWGAGGYSSGGGAVPPLAYIAEFSASGVPLWAEAAGGSTGGAVGLGLANDIAGNVYMTGGFGDASITFGTTTLNRSYPAATPRLAVFLVQYSPTHSVPWAKTIGSSTNSMVSYSVALANCGEVWVSGTFNRDANIDGNILASPTSSIPGTDPIFIAGYSLAGALISYSALSSGGDDENGIAVDNSGNLYVCGDFWNTYPFSIGPDVLSSASGGAFSNEFLYLGKYTINMSTDTTFVHHDTTVCAAVADITLSAPPGYTAYSWSNAVTSSTINATVSGSYWVVCNGSCSMPVRIDTFHVSFIPVGTSSHDTVIVECDGTSTLSLNGDHGYTSYTWSTGASSMDISVSDTGLYWVHQTNSCGFRDDTFKIKLATPIIETTATNQMVCNTSAVSSISGVPGYTSYLWSTGNTDISISVTAIGTYWVKESIGCNVRIDTFNIILAPPVNPIATTKVKDCNQVINFMAIPNGTQYTYLWQGPLGYISSLQNPTILNAPAILDQGVFTLTVVDNTSGCGGLATTIVTINPAVYTHLTNISANQIIEFGNDVQLNADSATYYMWTPNDGTINNPNINNPIVRPTQTTIYTVYGMDSTGCVDSAKIVVEVIFDSVFIPSAFTPNGDGLNDVFHPVGLRNQKLLEFSIFNRWGQQIFTTNNKNLGWDGTFSNVKQEMDVYNYVLIVEFNDLNLRTYKGNVTLIR